MMVAYDTAVLGIVFKYHQRIVIAIFVYRCIVFLLYYVFLSIYYDCPRLLYDNYVYISTVTHVGEFNKQYKVPFSRILNDILLPDHLQWQPSIDQTWYQIVTILPTSTF